MRSIARLIYQANKLFWRITRPVTVGVRVLLLKEDQVLLVKHTYQDHWYLPGGRVKKGETFAQAIRREVSEELGAELEDLRLFGVYNNFFEYKNDHVIIFICDSFSFSGNTDWEIERYGLFDIRNLPDAVSPGTRKRIREYLDGNVPNFGVW